MKRLAKGLFLLLQLLCIGCNPLATNGAEAVFLRPPPAAFGFVYVVPLDEAAFVQWSLSLGADSYELYRKVGSGEPTLIYSGTDYWYHDEAVENGTEYTYTAVAVGLSGNTPSSYSGEVTQGDPFYSEAVVTPAADPGPFTMTSAVAGDSEIVVTWGSSANATSYYLFRGTESGIYSEQFDEVTSPYTDTTAATGITYYYTVVAASLSATINADNEVSATPNRF